VGVSGGLHVARITVREQVGRRRLGSVTSTPVSTVYRSAHVGRPARARRAATMIAAVLTMVGAALLIAGLAGVAGLFPVAAFREALLLGLGLSGLGAGTLLLVALRSLRH
jgi:hypothetical protein